MHLRYWKWEFRDGRHQLECRLVPMAPSDLHPPVPFAPFGKPDGQLVRGIFELSRRLRSAGVAATAPAIVDELHQAIGEALDEDTTNTFYRLAMQAHGSAAGSALFHDLVIATLAPAAADAAAPGDARALLAGAVLEAFGVFAKGDVGLRVHLPQPARPQPAATPTERPEWRPLRILVLVGNLRDPLAAGRHVAAAAKTIRNLGAQVPGNDLSGAVEVYVACASGAAPELQQGVPIDAQLGSAVHVQHLLAHGTLQPDAEFPYDILVTFGHSDGTATTQATSIEFDFGGATAEPIAAQTLARWVQTGMGNFALRNAPPSPLGAALLLNCRSADFAAELLTCAEHVVAAHPLLLVDHAHTLCDTLFRQLLSDVSLADAVRATRQQLDTHGWQIAHLARATADPAFVSRERAALQRFYGDAYAKYARPTLRLGQGQEHEVPLDLAAVHVDLTIDGWHSGSLQFRELLALPHRRWVLRGEPGAGKTTTLLACALGWPPGKFVLYSSLSRWARMGAKGTVTGASLCRDLVRDTIPRDQEDLFVRAVEQRAQCGNLIVLLDAYDELESEHQRAVKDLLSWFGTNWPHATVVVSARIGTALPVQEVEPARDRQPGENSPSTPPDPLAWQRAVLRPLDAPEQRRFLTNWFRVVGKRSDADDLGERAVAAISGCGPRLQELAGNPLQLTFLADHMVRQLASGAGTDCAWLHELRRHELLARVIDACLAGSYAHETERVTAKVPDGSIDDVRGLLRRLAWEMSIAGKVEVEVRMLQGWLFPKKRAADGIDHRRVLKDGEWSETSFLAVLKDWAGILRPEDTRKNARWRFVHRQLQEALAAEYWWHVRLRAVRPRDLVKAVLADLRRQALAAKARTNRNSSRPKPRRLHADTDFWTETAAMLVENLDAAGLRADRLLVPLWRDVETHAIGLRVLAALDLVQPETVSELLRVLPEWLNLGLEAGCEFRHWHPRAQVLELLGERLPCGQEPLPVRAAPLHQRLADPDPRIRSIAVLEQHASDVTLLPVEIGAIVHCIERAGRRWRQRKQAEPQAMTARTVLPVVREAVARIATQPRFGTRSELLDLRRRQPDLPDWRWCEVPEAKDFAMGTIGSTYNERPPAIPVQLPRFWMQATSVTEAHYGVFARMGTPSRLPVSSVSWYEALLYSRWLAAVWPESPFFDLPTEAEREWATRGGTTTAYWSGDTEEDLRRVGWSSENSGRRMHNVAELPANPFGLFDMHGNIWEWCLDGALEPPPGGNQPSPSSPRKQRVLRGGSCRSYAFECRAARRLALNPGAQDPIDDWMPLGFRLVCVRRPPQLRVSASVFTT